MTTLMEKTAFQLMLEESYAQVVEAAGDLSRIGDVLREVRTRILEHTTIEDIEAALLCRANVPIVGFGIKSGQGYVGRFRFAGGELVHYGFSSAYRSGEIKPLELDTLQQAFGDTNYIGMLPAKAFYSLAYAHRPQEARGLSFAEYLAQIEGFHMGSAHAIDADGSVVMASATGFQPDMAGVQYLRNIPGGINHLNSEPVPAFRASGLCDQVVAEKATGVFNRQPHSFKSIAHSSVRLLGMWH